MCRDGTSGRGPRRIAAASHPVRDVTRGLMGPTDSSCVRAMERLFELGGVAPESLIVESGAGRMHGITAGSGRPVLLLHGASGGAANWFRVLGPLAARYGVMAPDLPGFGLSEGGVPDSGVTEWAAGRVMAWLDAVGWSVGPVVGTSFGSHVALRLVQRHPERFSRLVLINSTGLGRDAPILVRVAALPGLRRALLAPSRRGAAWVFRRFLTTDRSTLSEDETQALLDYLYVTGRRGVDTMVRSFPRVIGPFGQRDVLSDAELSRIGHPVLLLWGEHDGFLPPAHGERAARVLPVGRFTLLRGVGHSPNWERPDLVLNGILDFMEDG